MRSNNVLSTFRERLSRSAISWAESQVAFFAHRTDRYHVNGRFGPKLEDEMTLRKRIRSISKWPLRPRQVEVQPPPVFNRRTGEEHTFGPRRAYDGAWVIEMLEEQAVA